MMILRLHESFEDVFGYIDIWVEAVKVAAMTK